MGGGIVGSWSPVCLRDRRKPKQKQQSDVDGGHKKI